MLNHEIANDIAEKLVTLHVIKDGWQEWSLVPTERVKDILDALPPEQRLNPMFLVRALVKQEIIAKDDTQDATETLKPLLAEWRAKVKQQKEVEPVQEQATPEVEVFPVLAQVVKERQAVMTGGKAKIFSDIPMPGRGQRVESWPWRDLSVGHSFFAPGAGIKSMRSMIVQKNRKLEPMRFTAREWEIEGEKGVMVWRVE